MLFSSGWHMEIMNENSKKKKWTEVAIWDLNTGINFDSMNIRQMHLLYSIPATMQLNLSCQVGGIKKIGNPLR